MALCGGIGAVGYIFFFDESHDLGITIPERVFQMFMYLRIWAVLKLARFIQSDLAINKVSAIIVVSIRLAGKLGPFLLYMCAILYLFASVGVGLFSPMHQSDMDLVAGSAYASTNLYPEGVNFNAISAAFFTLLHQLLQNNWFVTHDACMVAVERLYMRNHGGVCGGACGLQKWGVTFYFVMFQISVSIVFVNLVISFFLDAYNFHWIKTYKRRNEAVRAVETAASNRPMPSSPASRRSRRPRSCSVRSASSSGCTRCLRAMPRNSNSRASSSSSARGS